MLGTLFNNGVVMLAAFNGIFKQQCKPFFHVATVLSLLFFLCNMLHGKSK